MTTPVYSNPDKFTLVDSSLVAGFQGGVQVQLAEVSGGPYSVGTVLLPLSQGVVTPGTAAAPGSVVYPFSALVAACAALSPPVKFTPGVTYYAQAELYEGVPPLSGSQISPFASPEAGFVIPVPVVTPNTPTGFSFGT